MYDKTIPPKTKEIDDEDVYEEPSRDEMVEDDEITPGEEGFMDGYEQRDVLKKTVKAQPDKKKTKK